ncbi:putative DNA binding domain-containing protein [Caloramator sp. mosi_1]|uniref:AlbA family DNA-binding domain-containing protein n=1 Tax=Caloramator sp. mosi_1 TaxID=3023090 RepID=UPI00235F1BB7|nr:RNA-binding domain-containing protein [Caloramator sp. mosi_1]WDC84352.1 putative DNA binding domain-containing protein [Caloramator sp. mosi_1]
MVGINKEDFNEEKIQQIISTRLDPPVTISAELVNLHGKYLGIITIYSSNNKPHQLKENGAFYIRRGSTTDFMHKEEIAYMLQEYGLIHIEQTPVFNAQVSDFDFNLVEKYFTLSGLSFQRDDAQLISSGFLYQDRETKKYILQLEEYFFLKQYSALFSHTSILIKDFASSSEVSVKLFAGNILNQLNAVSNYISSIKKYDNIDVINFCISKAIIERNYLNINRCIEVFIYKDKIEIVIPGLIDKNNFKKLEFKNIWMYFKLMIFDVDKKFIYPNIKKLKKIKVFEGPSQEITKVIIR